MTIDITKLKALATAAAANQYDAVALNDYGTALPPVMVLGLIAEIERHRLINAEGCKPDSNILLGGLPCTGFAPFRSLNKAEGCKPDLNPHPFERENRYIVIKRSDLNLLSPIDRDLAMTDLESALSLMSVWDCPAREYLVIEGDWPEFEPAWTAIEARMTGKPAEQHHGEPVGYQQRTMTDRPGSQWTPWRECCGATRDRYSHEVGHFNQHGIMREIRPVFAFQADPGEVERLRAQLAGLETLHGGELGLPKEGWPEYHKRKMESLRNLNAGYYERKLAERDAQIDILAAKFVERGALLREVRDTCALWLEDHRPTAYTQELDQRICAALSASADPSAPAEHEVQR